MDKSLYTWIHNQKQQYKKGLLSKRKIEQLESVTGWVWEVDLDAHWTNKLNELKDYIEANGKFPPKGSNLNYFIQLQRNKYKENKQTPYRIHELEKIEGWFWRFDKLDHWFNRANKLKGYMETSNKLPSRKTEFGDWLQDQRKFYSKGKLSEDQIKKLESVNGWFWKANIYDKWFIKAEAIKQIIIDTGEIPKQRTTAGRWCSGQREQYKKRSLSKEQIETLEKIKHWYWRK
jgi:hypothetical protein